MRSWVEVNLTVLKRNASSVRTALPSGVFFYAIVKANAYGHGMVEVANTLVDSGVDAFGVASIEEGLRLREAGFHTPILLLSPPLRDECDSLIRYDLTPTITTINDAKSVGSCSEKAGKVVEVHLKVDTGMGRFGLRGKGLDIFLEEIASIPSIHVTGLYSHLSSAEDVNDKPSQRQFEIFNETVSKMKELAFPLKCIHMLNSAGTQRFQKQTFHAVRIGGLLYGMNLLPGPLQTIETQPVLSVKTRILSVRTLPKGSTVGYGGDYITSQDEKIVTLPIGYGDGLFRQALSGGEVLWKGRRRPIVGRMSMDLVTVSMKMDDTVECGDEVTLVGKCMEERITLEDLAERANSISYEMACHLGSRLKRRYVA